MLYFRFALTALLLSGWATSAAADGPPAKDQSNGVAKVSPEEIDRLILQLGDDDLAKRQLARKQLEAAGEPAIAGLKKAAEASDDPEVKKAAKALLEKFEAKARGVLNIFNVGKTRINGVAFSADGRRAVCSGWDGQLRYFDLEEHTLIRQMSGGRVAIMSVVFSPDGKRILSGGGDTKMRLWDLESGIVLQTLETHKNGRAWTVAFTRDGKQAVTGGGNTFEKTGGPAASLRLWDLATGKEIREFQGHTKDIRRVAISPDGTQMLSASFDGTVRLWDLATGKQIKKFDGPGNFVESVSFTPDGKRAVCSYGPGSAEAVYAEDPQCSLKLWDIATGKELKLFKGHGGPVLCLAISRDGEMLLSGSADGSMRLWEIPK